MVTRKRTAVKGGVKPLAVPCGTCGAIVGVCCQRDDGAENQLLDSITATDGMEIPRGLWPVAERLVARGLITLSAARGPGRDWRRAELLVASDVDTVHVEVAVIAAGGQSIEAAARDAIAVRATRECSYVWLIFNNLPVVVDALDTVDTVCDRYAQLRKEHHYGEHCALRRTP